MSADRVPGGAAEEAARLFEALQDAATAWSRGQAPGSGGAEGAHDHAPTPQACRLCPLCQLVTAVRQVRPETVQHLADAAASLAAALADLVPAAGPPRKGPERGDGAPRRPADVQHIDISD